MKTKKLPITPALIARAYSVSEHVAARWMKLGWNVENPLEILFRCQEQRTCPDSLAGVGNKLKWHLWMECRIEFSRMGWTPTNGWFEKRFGLKAEDS